MCIFGTIGIFVRYIPLPSGVIALSRGVIGALFLSLVKLLQKSKVSLDDVKRNLVILCLSGACLGINWMLLFEAYRHTTVATATLCYYLAPVFVTLASPIVLKERLTGGKLICVAAALLGMAFVSGVFDSADASITGVLYGVAAAVFYACVVLFNKKLVSISAYDMTIVQLSVAAITLLPYVLLSTKPDLAALAPLSIALLIAVGIVHTGVSYAMYFGSMKDLKAQTVAIFSYIDPVVAILLSALLLKEKLGVMSVIGAVLILGSTLVSELLENRKMPE